MILGLGSDQVSVTQLFLLSICSLQSIKKPSLFWVSAGAPLVSVILATLVVFASKAQHHGISVVSLCSLFAMLSTFWFQFCLTIFMDDVLDWKIARRVESSFMEHVTFSWKPLGTSYEDWAHNRHYFSDCKFPFNFTDFSWIC